MSPDKIVTRAISRAWPMTIDLPDLGSSFTVQPVTAGNPRVVQAAGGRIPVTPGVYVLSSAGPVEASTLPATVGRISFAEYHAPPPDSLGPSVTPLAATEYLAGRDAELRARLVDQSAPDSAKLFIRLLAGDFYQGYPMRSAGGYEYTATVPAAQLRVGPHEFVIVWFRGGSAITFPEALHQQPWDWNYYGSASWKLNVVSAETPVRLFSPTDAARLAFTRIGDAGRRGLFRVGISGSTGQPIFHLELPVTASGWSPPDYTASLVIRDRIKARQETIIEAPAVRLRLRGLGSHQVLHVSLMEEDGTTWTAAVPVDSTWSQPWLPLTAFTAGRGVLLPEGFPGEWNYWVGPAAARGGSGDHPRLDHLERIQLSLRPEAGVPATAGSYGVEIEWITLGGRR